MTADASTTYSNTNSEHTTKASEKNEQSQLTFVVRPFNKCNMPKTLRNLSWLLYIEAPQKHPKQHFFCPSDVFCVSSYVSSPDLYRAANLKVFHRDPSLHRSVCTVHRCLQSSNDPWPLPQNLWKNKRHETCWVTRRGKGRSISAHGAERTLPSSSCTLYLVWCSLELHLEMGALQYRSNDQVIFSTICHMSVKSRCYNEPSHWHQ